MHSHVARTLIPPSAFPVAFAADEQAPKILTGQARTEVRRVHASVLLFYLVDGLLLTGYAWCGSIAWQVGWLYALVGCAGSSISMFWFWRRGGRHEELDRMSLGQTVFAGSVMLATLAFAPQVGGLMLMSLMAVVSLSAVQMAGRQVMVLCLAFSAASVAVLALTGGAAAVPTATPGERSLTGVWLVWLMLKASAHNVAGQQLRRMVSKANAKLADALREVEQVAATDELTVLPNRRSIVGQLKAALERAPTPGWCVGVAVLDIDNFKRVNDRYGHDVGDQVLCAFAASASASLRPSDRVGRYGGEEFLLVLQQLPDARSAADAVERVRARIEAHDWNAVQPGLAVTVSAGVALVWPDETSGAAIQRADAALYDAKHQGRNRVVLREALTRLG